MGCVSSKETPPYEGCALILDGHKNGHLDKAKNQWIPNTLCESTCSKCGPLALPVEGNPRGGLGSYCSTCGDWYVIDYQETGKEKQPSSIWRVNGAKNKTRAMDCAAWHRQLCDGRAFCDPAEEEQIKWINSERKKKEKK